MQARTFAAAMLAALALAGCAASDPEAPDPEAPTIPATATSPYTGLVGSPIRGLTPEQIDAYANGKGASMALAAELNGYPGPTHVLELGDQMELSAEQRAAMERLKETMRANAIARGEELLALHKALDDGFRNGTLDDAGLAGMLEEIAMKEAQLRFVHLSTHFDASELLTPHQRARYFELRGYGSGDHASHEH